MVIYGILKVFCFTLNAFGYCGSFCGTSDIFSDLSEVVSKYLCQQVNHVTIKVCLYVLMSCPSLSQSLSKFNIVPMVMGTLISRMDSSLTKW